MFLSSAPRTAAPFARLFLLACFFVFGFTCVLGRLFYLCRLEEAMPSRPGGAACTRRGDFVDRNGLLIATTLKTSSLYANLRHAENPRKLAKEIAKALAKVFPDKSTAFFEKKLSDSQRFTWLARHLSPAQKKEILLLGIPELALIDDQKRIYPHGPLFSHLVGFTDPDNRGLCGLEMAHNKALAQAAPIKLTLDTRVQHVVREELVRAVGDSGAEAANGIVANIKTGEVLAAVSLPDYNPNQGGNHPTGNLFNKNSLGAYEMGSLLKIHNAAMALETGVCDLASVFDASHPLQVGRFLVTDFRGKNRPMTFKEAFLCSSNIVNAKVALQAGAQRQKEFFKKLGLFAPLPLEIPERATPIVPQHWTEPTVITVSYGYGIALSPFHVVQSISTIVDGFSKPLVFVKSDAPPPRAEKDRVISSGTSEKIRQLLQEAVLEGQAQRARIPGYLVGGKTGTANILENGSYKQKNNLTSFVGVFPANDPQYIVLVMLRRPKPKASTYGFATAGWFAAPLGAAIIQKVAPLLGIFPFPEGHPEEGIRLASHVR